MSSRQLRLLRGSAASSIATFTAAVSHTVGGGAAPHPLLILALSVFLTPAAAILVGRTPHVAKLSAAVLLSQTVFHVLFVSLGATMGTGGSAHGHHHELVLPQLSSTIAPLAPDAAMLAAHVVAGIATTVMLWRGERLVRTIARWVRTVLRRRALRPLTTFAQPPALGLAGQCVISAVPAGDLCPRGPPFLLRG